jgi:hypothetical protein
MAGWVRNLHAEKTRFFNGKKYNHPNSPARHTNCKDVAWAEFMVAGDGFEGQNTVAFNDDGNIIEEFVDLSRVPTVLHEDSSAGKSCCREGNDIITSEFAKEVPECKKTKNYTSVNAPIINKGRGLAYDTKQIVDDQIRKRLLRNRESAERCRQRRMKEEAALQENLVLLERTRADLRLENETLRQQLVELQVLTSPAFRTISRERGVTRTSHSLVPRDFTIANPRRFFSPSAASHSLLPPPFPLS